MIFRYCLFSTNFACIPDISTFISKRYLLCNSFIIKSFLLGWQKKKNLSPGSPELFFPQSLHLYSDCYNKTNVPQNNCISGPDPFLILFMGFAGSWDFFFFFYSLRSNRAPLDRLWNSPENRHPPPLLDKNFLCGSSRYLMYILRWDEFLRLEYDWRHIRFQKTAYNRICIWWHGSISFYSFYTSRSSDVNEMYA